MPESNTISQEVYLNAIGAVDEPDSVEPDEETVLVQCGYCEEFVSSDNISARNEICDFCIDNTSLCYGCDGRMADDDMLHSDYDGENRCRSCHESHSDRYNSDDEPQDEDDKYPDSYGIYPYGFKPKPYRFFGQGPLFLGFEQEVTHRHGDFGDGATFVNNNNSAGIVYLKYDCTVSAGFEIVTHPMSLDHAMSEFTWKGISGLKNKGFRSWNDENCGLHVHMTRSAFKDWRHLYLLIRFIYLNKKDVVDFAGRESEYAAFDMDSFIGGWWDYDTSTVRKESLPKYIKGGKDNAERRQAVNLQNRETVELRFFRPSLNVKTVQASLQFCDALFHYTSIVETRDIIQKGALAFNSFRSWLGHNNDPRYELLRARIDLRCSTLGEDN